MDSIRYIEDYLGASVRVKQALLKNGSIHANISEAAELIVNTYRSGNKVLLAGNGGSAGDAQHIAAEFVSRFFYDRPGLPALALSTDTSMLTAIGNDYGFDRLFSRQVQAQGKRGDVFIGISTSGQSQNILNAVHEAREMGIHTLAMCGNAGSLGSLVDISLSVPSSSTPHIQECHILIGHLICGIVEEKIFPDHKPNV